jgi:hypothetical protein
MRYDEPRHVLTSEEHGSRHPTRRRRCLWRWWRGGGVVGIGVGGESKRSGEGGWGLAGGSTTLWLPRVS